MIMVSIVSVACVAYALVTTVRALATHRLTAVVILGGWVAVAALLADRGFFVAPTLPPRLALSVLVPFALLLAARSVSTGFRRVLDELPLSWLIGAQLFRVVGVALLLGYAAGILPAHFALTAGIGDVITGVAAPFVARASSRRLKIAWSVFGLVDLVDAVVLGVLSAPTPLRQFFDDPSTMAMGRLPLALLPAFIVPLGLTLHVLALRRLSSPASPALPDAPARRGP